MVYVLFYARDGIWGSDGIWAEKDPTRLEWGEIKVELFLFPEQAFQTTAYISNSALYIG